MVIVRDADTNPGPDNGTDTVPVTDPGRGTDTDPAGVTVPDTVLDLDLEPDPDTLPASGSRRRQR